MAKELEAQKIIRARKIIKELYKLYPEAECSLDYKTPFQLLIATMLSAQCTDVRVNLTTPALFERYKSPKELSEAEISELEQLVRSTGFYKNKAKNIKACAHSLVEKYKSEVPQTMEELHSLAGVGRKTANVVLGNAFGVPSMVVDTHVTRLSNRLGWVKTDDAVKIETQLMTVIDKKFWTDLSHLLIYHGRAICMARSPLCEKCKLSPLCPKIGVVKKKAKG
jgi:endonuclease-3